MTTPDYLVIAAYAIGLVVIGAVFSRKIRDSDDMFVAGGQAPWWVSGLSAYMTMFSAGTFVVWGGIAYREGLVAVTICLGNGVAAMLAGWFLAGRWHRLGISTAAEYFELRFGETAVRVYTLFNVSYKLVSIAVALYSISVLICALVPLPEGAWFRDAETGNLSVSWTVVLCGVLVIGYTMAGGLWAVLMTDVIQFIVLMLCVLLVVPLALAKAGGLVGFVDAAPEGFFRPATAEYTWWFLFGWVTVQFASIGGEWAFIQRYLCVPTPHDARKGTYLFGVLYLITPLFWMLPPMLYRVISPDADCEQAYILACREVLPAGMVGLMVAAMFSATASMIDSQLNVFSGVLTYDFYRRLLRPRASQPHLIFIGRVTVILLGVLLLGATLAVPHVGGAEQAVLGIAALLIMPLMMPTIWGLFSRRIGRSALWGTIGISFAASAFVKFGMVHWGWFDGYGAFDGILRLVRAHFRTAETLVAVIVPVLVLGLLQLASRSTDRGWCRLRAYADGRPARRPAPPSPLPSQMVGWCLASLAATTIAVAAVAQKEVLTLAVFAGLLLATAAVSFWYSWRIRSTVRRTPKEAAE